MGLITKIKEWFWNRVDAIEDKVSDYEVKKAVEDRDSLLVKSFVMSFAVTDVRSEDFSNFVSYLHEIYAPHGILSEDKDEMVVRMLIINVSYDDMAHIRKKFRLDGFKFTKPNYDGAHFVTWTYHRGDKKPSAMKYHINIDRTYLETIGYLYDGVAPVHMKIVAHEINGRTDLTGSQKEGLLTASISDVYTCEQRKKYRERLYNKGTTTQINGEEN